MAKNSANKRGPKANAAATPSTSAPPVPFEPAPASLQPFLENLSKSQLYIVHIDRHPADFKRRIFIVPLLLNLTILGLLVWRLYAISPWYGSVLLTVLGYDSPTTINMQEHSRGELASIIVRRAGTFLLDFVLVRFIAPWPYTFFLEAPGNPVSWRWRVGFKEREVYVRVSRSFTAEDFLGAKEQGPGNPFFKVRVLPAVEADYLRQKTGYLTMGADWDLDFANMVAAQELVEQGDVDTKVFERSVFVWCGDEIGWAIWDCSKDEERTGIAITPKDEDDFLKKLAAEAEREEERYRE